MIFVEWAVLDADGGTYAHFKKLRVTPPDL